MNLIAMDQKGTGRSSQTQYLRILCTQLLVWLPLIFVVEAAIPLETNVAAGRFSAYGRGESDNVVLGRPPKRLAGVFMNSGM